MASLPQIMHEQDNPELAAATTRLLDPCSYVVGTRFGMAIVVTFVQIPVCNDFLILDV